MIIYIEYYFYFIKHLLCYIYLQTEHTETHVGKVGSDHTNTHAFTV